MPLTSDPAIERALGATEELYWRFDPISPINFGAVSRLRGDLDTTALKNGIDALQARHPLLRVRIEPDASGKPWYRSGVGPIPVAIADDTPESLWARLEQALVTPFPAEGPLMRVDCVRHADGTFSLMMVFHHAVSDGRSSVFLHRDLLRSLARQARGEEPWLEPLPPLEYYGERIPPVGKYDLRTALKTLRASVQFMEDAGLPVGLRQRRHDEPDFQDLTLLIEPRVIDPELMAKIARKAKDEQTTLQCVLNAALSLSVARDSPTDGFQRTGCTQVLDIRGRLDPPVQEDVGCFASGATSLHQLGPDTAFWPLTRKVHTHLQNAIVTPLPFFFPALHKLFVGVGRGFGLEDPKRFGRFISRLHPEGLAVSNLGRVQIDVPDSPVQVMSYGFGTNTMVFNYLNTSAATFDGRMIWTFNGSSRFGRNRLARVADGAIERMERALEE